MIHILRVVLVLYLHWPSSLQDENVIEKIKSQVTTNMSSQYSTWSAEKAIDYSDNRTNPNVCNCCAGANRYNTWWSLDLGKTYPIKTIIYIGRSDYPIQSRGFKIYKVVSGSKQLIHENKARSGNEFTIDLNLPVALQQMKITHHLAVSICQLKLIESETCPAGSFGQHCEKRCRCSNTLPCNRSYGVCSTDGCAPGWNGRACDLECNNGSFGQNCNSVCHCKNNVTCNHINGKCPGGICAPGWKESNCSTECSDGSFGQKCSSVCHCQDNTMCNHINGECKGGVCAPRWTGFNCSTECYDGSFGQNCNSLCHCQNNAVCDRENGKCPSGVCALGWKGLNCSTECYDGYFGQNCSSVCHCLNNDMCNHTNGECPGGVCAPGWKGFDCSAECYDGYFGQNCSSVCHCLNNDMCNHTTGECPGGVCAPGWKGFDCSAECDHGTFGQDCQSKCHCLDQSCDHVNGSCPSGLCDKGWKGISCNTECYDGSFGQNCSWTCHCKNNVTCDHVHGTCPDGFCSPGWKGFNCNEECYDGLFGQNCSWTCHCKNNVMCDHVHGTCPDGFCSPGWKGFNCNEECDHGTFGQDCHSECHCLDQPCDRVDGICLSGLCDKGWKGVNCNTACSNETFGQNCTSTCHCHEASVCHHIDGSCGDSGCKSGWEGNNCSIVAEAITEIGGGVPTGAIVGAVCGVIALLIVIFAIIVYRKRTSRLKKSETNRQTFTDLENNIKADKQTSVKQSERMTPRKRNSEKETVQVDKDHMYYSFATTTKKIQLHELWEYINLAYNNKCERLHQEFQKLPHGLVLDCNEARRLENAKKNRYKDMVAYDHSRVILKREDPCASTYINACHIDGFQAENKFIASQGPTENTAGDFWDMVIQEKTSVIVMLTNLVELGKRKCFQYWPSDEKEERTFGDVKVSTAKITILPDYIIRELDIAKTENAGESPRRVTQYHFTVWPDKDVPDVAWHLVNLWRKVVSQVGTRTEPVLVHCSAGVGRTGTYIALDSLHAQAKLESYIQPFEIVTRMRQQRVNMVQTRNQYVFLHEAVAEALYLGVKSVKTNEYDALYTSLLETDKTTGTTGLEQQFNLVQENRTTTSDENVYCNVKPAKECDEYRPKGLASASLSQSDGLDMCPIQNYTGKDTFILTRTSDEDKLVKLWKLIEKHNVKTVITFHDEIDRTERLNDELRTKHSTTDDSKHGLELLETKQEKQFIVKSFAAKPNKSGKAIRSIKQFAFLAWNEGAAVPTDTQSVIALLNAVQRWQPTVDDAQPILINDKCGFGRSGLICLLLGEFERVRIKEEVNVLETLKRMKDRNPQLMPNYASYKFCHAAVLEYIRQSDVYMNV